MLYYIPSIGYCDSFEIVVADGFRSQCEGKIASFIFSSSKNKVMSCRWTESFRFISKTIMSPLCWCACILSFISNKNCCRGSCCIESDDVYYSYTVWTPTVEGLHGRYVDINLIALSFLCNLVQAHRPNLLISAPVLITLGAIFYKSTTPVPLGWYVIPFRSFVVLKIRLEWRSMHLILAFQLSLISTFANIHLFLAIGVYPQLFSVHWWCSGFYLLLHTGIYYWYCVNKSLMSLLPMFRYSSKTDVHILANIHVLLNFHGVLIVVFVVVST